MSHPTEIIFRPVNIAIMTVSDSRILADDKSGDTLVKRLEADGHVLVDRTIVKDVVSLITAQLQVWIDDPAIEVVVSTGGTGVTGRDVTPEAFSKVGRKIYRDLANCFAGSVIKKLKHQLCNHGLVQGLLMVHFYSRFQDPPVPAKTVGTEFCTINWIFDISRAIL